MNGVYCYTWGSLTSSSPICPKHCTGQVSAQKFMFRACWGDGMQKQLDHVKFGVERNQASLHKCKLWTYGEGFSCGQGDCICCPRASTDWVALTGTLLIHNACMQHNWSGVMRPVKGRETKCCLAKRGFPFLIAVFFFPPGSVGTKGNGPSRETGVLGGRRRPPPIFQVLVLQEHSTIPTLRLPSVFSSCWSQLCSFYCSWPE